jgi:cysteine desulfurase
MQGIAASSGSACTSASMEPSHVLTAMGVPADLAHGALRMTFGFANTGEHVARVLDVLPKTVEKARKLQAGAPVA